MEPSGRTPEPSVLPISVRGEDFAEGTMREHQRDHARPRATRRFRDIYAICSLFVVALPLAVTPFPPENLDGKEGVVGSSPTEGSAQAQQIWAFCFRSACTRSSVQWVWSLLWSFQVQDARSCQPCQPATERTRTASERASLVQSEGAI